ncbi:MAG: DUF4296 domain-containing protein [Flavobacterium sp.]|nr:DUF4296 domain-containing protein [Flavobacterium sp.]MBP8157204.1 DUF4296 domain-containing protein [Flavobacterium sp.]
MCKTVIWLGLLGFFISCSNGVDKPKNLIKKDKMIDILYDISLLEAIKSQNINGGISTKNANDFLFKKYKIDSVQLEKSNKYYASDIEEYKLMYQEVKKRLEEETKKGNGKPNESIIPDNPDAPRVE